MSSSFLALLFGLFLLHTSMAIKCIAQPDYEELKKFEKEFPDEEEEEHNLEKYKQAWLRMMKTRAEVDCTDIARKYGLAEPTHCATSDDLSNCTGLVEAAALLRGIALEELRRIKAKECHFEELTASIESSSNNEWTPENICHVLEKRFDCPRCQVCNESDFCNSGTEMASTTEGKSTTEVTVEFEERNGAGLTMNGAPQALFLLLLAIATGAFRWAAYH